MTISFNPLQTTNNAGGFSVQSYGLVQGVAMDDPAARFALMGGVLATTETLPMWGGVGVAAAVPSLTPNYFTEGPVLSRATGITNTSAGGLWGFSVFNQAHAWINWPQSPVPTGQGGMTVPFFMLGSGARIAVKCEPDLISLAGGGVGAQVSWNFTDQILQPYVASVATEAVTSMTWSATNGGQVAVVMTGASIYKLGDIINVSGVTNTGTGNVALINTDQVINTYTDTTHFTFLLPGTSTLWGTFAGTIVLNVGTAALPCQVLRVENGNSKVVQWDPVNLVATWNNSGCAALIQI